MLSATVVHLADAPVPYALPQAWRYVTKFLYFAGFAAAFGAAVVHLLALRPALSGRRSAGASESDTAVLRNRSSLVLAWSGLLYLISLYPQLAGKVARADKTGGTTFWHALLPSEVSGYLNAPGKGAGIPLGTMVLVQFLMFGLACLLLMALWAPAVRRRMDSLVTVSAVLLLLGQFALVIAGDIAAKTADDWMGSVPDQVHATMATTWIGGVVALLWLSGVRRNLTGGAGQVWAHVWKRFSRVAQVCVGAVICTGLWLAWEAVGTVPTLWSTPFGRYLMLKLALVLTLIGIGFYNEFKVLPKISRIRAQGDERGLFALTLAHFPRVAALESALGLGVLLVVPFLNGTGREENGQALPSVTGGAFTAAAVLVVVVVVGFLAGSKVQGGVERRAAETAPAPQGDPAAV